MVDKLWENKTPILNLFSHYVGLEFCLTFQYFCCGLVQNQNLSWNADIATWTWPSLQQPHISPQGLLYSDGTSLIGDFLLNWMWMALDLKWTKFEERNLNKKFTKKFLSIDLCCIHQLIFSPILIPISFVKDKFLQGQFLDIGTNVLNFLKSLGTET